MLTRLHTHVVEKPWGRTDIPGVFGVFAGRRIGEIWFSHPDGAAASIMIKFLFTSERLSIQVHPDDNAAQEAGFTRGKDECWLILYAAPDAEIGVGLRRATTPDALHHAALDGSIVDMIDWQPVQAGDFIYNPAGTIHAIGAGLIAVEVQQNVDCTYRLYDYGRPRPLHFDEGLAVAQLAPHRDQRNGKIEVSENRMLVDGPHFHLLHLAGPDATALLPQESGQFTFTPLTQGCTIAGESISLGESVATECAHTIALALDARALLCWPAYAAA